FQAFKIEHLLKVEARSPALFRGKESFDIASFYLAADLLVIGSIAQQKFLITAHQRARFNAESIPNKHQPSFGLQDSREFDLCFLSIEPMEGLAGDNKIYGIIRERGRFSRRVQAKKFWILCQQSFDCGARFLIWLNTKNAVSVLEN